MIRSDYLRVALRGPFYNAILTSAINIEATQVAWENRAFDVIDGLYVVENLMPVSGEPWANYLPGGYGIYQLSVHGVRGHGTEDAEALAWSIGNLYENGAECSHTVNSVTARAVFDAAFVAAGYEDSGRWVFPVRVDYRAFDR
jgi:hypothetical protein